MWLQRFDDLTSDQQAAVHAPDNVNLVITGPPGSGKTLVLIHRLLKTTSPSGHRAKLLVRNRAMVGYLRGGLSGLTIDPKIVSTADSLVMTLFRRFVRGPLPELSNNALDWETIRAATLKAIMDRRPSPLFDISCVDEGQDLSPDTLKIIKRVSKHVTVALSPQQAIYTDGSTLYEVRESLGTAENKIQLLRSWRTTPNVARLAAQFLPLEEAAEFSRLDILPTVGNESPVVYYYEDFQDQADELARQLTKMAYENYTCAVLLPTLEACDVYASALRQRGLAVSDDIDARFDDLVPDILTYHQAKGVTVDAAFLPGLTAENFDPFLTRYSVHLNRILHVGVTRASKWVWLGTRAGEELKRSALKRAIWRARVVRSSRQPTVEAEAPSVAPTKDDPIHWIY